MKDKYKILLIANAALTILSGSAFFFFFPIFIEPYAFLDWLILLIFFTSIFTFFLVSGKLLKFKKPLYKELYKTFLILCSIATLSVSLLIIGGNLLAYLMFGQNLTANYYTATPATEDPQNPGCYLRFYDQSEIYRCQPNGIFVDRRQNNPRIRALLEDINEYKNANQNDDAPVYITWEGDVITVTLYEDGMQKQFNLSSY